MQFKKGALVPYAGVVYRVEKADVFNGHVCYLLLDPQGVAQPVAHAQHSFIVEEIKRMARFQVRDKFTIQGYFGWRRERALVGQRARLRDVPLERQRR
ncbi:MAG: hypothetical protein IPG92_10675 [Flavobacteriales bacterium]|nr:hypothetical protein [Flavobacteriales bacterium]